MTFTASRKIAPGYEPIVGYTLEKKIGEGGFGEVWQCNAPGGLKKAVKFVFGASHADRGSRELKSLERIKGVHHPFLLTLERFGVVDDQLVIVTELADGSLEDILKRHLERGSCGIPRNALLSYLHDAADALDYLHSSYQLQHLDIKPGNLLMVGGHVKVGDFGLLKDLREADHSVVGGLTPIYAPPEVFDGRPNINSDQYSLAVMYQELLTGTRPFSGRTIAQLATQHIHAAPNLESLPPADRVAVAKALEKDPSRRFESCIAFVDALRTPRQRESTVVARTAASIDCKAGKVEDLPTLKADSRLVRSRVRGHALVVAVGGVGGECLHELRDRVAKLHSACPLDLHSVLIDTDITNIHAARLAEASDRIPPATILHTPLRSAQEYRDGSTRHLKTVSRRWIYNVPRSGETEGMRPLGRLAMVDHSQKIDTGLRAAIDHLAVVCGDRIPSIYVVGSLSGGTASGMVLDLTPRLRTLLDEAGLEHAPILPLFSSVCMQGNPHGGVALPDTHAAISEIRHFLLPGNSYPGDDAIAWPGVPAVRNPLRNAYVIAQSDTQDIDMPPASATIVDYLWADATGAGELLAQARRCDIQDAGSMARPMFRSVGVARLKSHRGLEENVLAPAAVRKLLLRWLGRPAESREISGPLAERLRKRCELDCDEPYQLVMKHFGDNETSITESISMLLRPLDCSSLRSVGDIEVAVLNCLDDTKMDDQLMRRSAGQLLVLRRELVTRLNDGRIDITSAAAAIQRIIDEVESGIKVHQDLLTKNQSDEKNANFIPTSERNLVDDLQLAEQTALNRIESLARRMGINTLGKIHQQLERFHTQLTETAIGIARAIRSVPGDNLDSENPWSEMPPEVQSRLQTVLERLHAETAPKWLSALIAQTDNHWEVESIGTELVDVCLPMVERIVDDHRETSEVAVDSPLPTTHSTADGISTSRIPKMINATAIYCTASNSSDGEPNWMTQTQTITNASVRKNFWKNQTSVSSALAMASPALLKCGGRQRLLLLVGNDSERESLEAKVAGVHKGSLTTVVIPGITPILIHEAQQIPIDDVLNRLAMLSGGDTQVSKRLHTRTDIAWNETVH